MCLYLSRGWFTTIKGVRVSRCGSWVRVLAYRLIVRGLGLGLGLGLGSGLGLGLGSGLGLGGCLSP